METKNSLIQDGWLRVIAYIPVVIIMIFIFNAIGFLIFALATGISIEQIAELQTANTSISLSQHFFLQVATFMGVLSTTIFFRRVIDQKSFFSLGLSVKNKTKDMLYGLFSGIVLIGGGFFILKSLGYLQVTSIQFDSKTVLISFGMFVLVAFSEEILVRGYILNNLMKSWNKYMALLVSSLIFSLMHVVNPGFNWVSFLNIILAGIVLGIGYIYTKNLWFPILLHFSWNFFQGPVFGFEVSGLDMKGIITQEVSGNELLTGSEFGFEGSLIATALILVLIVVFNKIFKKEEINE